MMTLNHIIFLAASCLLCVLPLQVISSPQYEDLYDELTTLMETSHAQQEEMDSLSRTLAQLEDKQKLLLAANRTLNQQQTAAAFSVRLFEDAEFGHEQMIRFDDIVTNIGGYYLPGPGFFMCPVNGAYFFSWSIQVRNGERHLSRLVKSGADGNIEVKRGPMTTLQEDGSETGTHSMSSVFECLASEVVWLEALVMVPTSDSSDDAAAMPTLSFQGEYTTMDGFLIIEL